MPRYPCDIMLNESSTRSFIITITQGKVIVYIRRNKYISTERRKTLVVIIVAVILSGCIETNKHLLRDRITVESTI